MQAQRAEPKMERKYLIRKAPAGLTNGNDIEQAYINIDCPDFLNKIRDICKINKAILSPILANVSRITEISIRSSLEGDITKYFFRVKWFLHRKINQVDQEIDENLFRKIWDSNLNIGNFEKRKFNKNVKFPNYRELDIEIDIFKKRLKGLFLAGIRFTDGEISPILLTRIVRQNLVEFFDVTGESLFKPKSLAILKGDISEIKNQMTPEQIAFIEKVERQSETFA